MKMLIVVCVWKLLVGAGECLIISLPVPLCSSTALGRQCPFPPRLDDASLVPSWRPQCKKAEEKLSIKHTKHRRGLARTNVICGRKFKLSIAFVSSFNLCWCFVYPRSYGKNPKEIPHLHLAVRNIEYNLGKKKKKERKMGSLTLPLVKLN